MDARVAPARMSSLGATVPTAHRHARDHSSSGRGLILEKIENPINPMRVTVTP